MSRVALVFLFALPLAIGCDRGPAQGTVKGKVTIDGKPVDGGLIKFIPADGKSQPADCIVTGGNYSVSMPIGEKKVEVWWTETRGSGKVDTASQGNEQVVALVPSKYNAETTLTYNLAKGEQIKDFDLTSK